MNGKIKIYSADRGLYKTFAYRMQLRVSTLEITRNIVFLDEIPCSLLNVRRNFGEIDCSNVGVKETLSKQHECSLLVCLDPDIFNTENVSTIPNLLSKQLHFAICNAELAHVSVNMAQHSICVKQRKRGG
jgi:hypothetical protein